MVSESNWILPCIVSDSIENYSKMLYTYSCQNIKYFIYLRNDEDGLIGSEGSEHFERSLINVLSHHSA